MKRFNGFPPRMQSTPVPNLFFSSLLPRIDDMAELKTTLHLFRALAAKQGYPRYISHRELLNNRSLLASLREGEKPPREALGDALDRAVERGTILRLVLDADGAPEEVYFLNTEPDRRAVSKIQSGELALAGLKAGRRPDTGEEAGPPPDIFSLYEDNIGMLTPMIADELREAEKAYPAGWVGDAIGEASRQGVHKWSYIAAILERWASEGRKDGAYRGDSKTAPDKYSGQKYGHIIRR